jgi:hypothetical protein
LYSTSVKRGDPVKTNHREESTRGIIVEPSGKKVDGAALEHILARSITLKLAGAQLGLHPFSDFPLAILRPGDG